MKYYLSSYQLGDKINQLKSLIKKTSGKFGYIPNALDFTKANLARRKKHIKSDMKDLEKNGAKVELLGLKSYFGKKESLKKKLLFLGGVYVSGGTTFVLRQAMKLSGFDELLFEMPSRDNFLYIAYSAGVCLLTKSMRQYAITDDAKDFPYPQIQKQIWEGLSIIDFVFEPHYKSDHPE